MVEFPVYSCAHPEEADRLTWVAKVHPAHNRDERQQSGGPGARLNTQILSTVSGDVRGMRAYTNGVWLDVESDPECGEDVVWGVEMEAEVLPTAHLTDTLHHFAVERARNETYPVKAPATCYARGVRVSREREEERGQ